MIQLISQCAKRNPRKESEAKEFGITRLSPRELYFAKKYQGVGAFVYALTSTNFPSRLFAHPRPPEIESTHSKTEKLNVHTQKHTIRENNADWRFCLLQSLTLGEKLIT